MVEVYVQSKDGHWHEIITDKLPDLAPKVPKPPMLCQWEIFQSLIQQAIERVENGKEIH